MKVFVAATAVDYEGEWVQGVAATLEDAQMIAEGEGLTAAHPDDYAQQQPWVEVSTPFDERRWEARQRFGELVVTEWAVLGGNRVAGDAQGGA